MSLVPRPIVQNQAPSRMIKPALKCKSRGQLASEFQRRPLGQGLNDLLQERVRRPGSEGLTSLRNDPVDQLGRSVIFVALVEPDGEPQQQCCLLRCVKGGEGPYYRMGIRCGGFDCSPSFTSSKCGFVSSDPISLTY